MRILLTLLIVAITTLPAAAQSRTEKLEALFSGLEQRGEFNGSIMIWQQDDVIFKRHVGFAKRDDAMMIDEDTSFELGSVTKTFTAIALFQLQQDYRVDMSAPITDYLRDLPYHHITPRAMLSHTSGMVDVYEQVALREKFFEFYGNVNVPYSNRDYYDFIVKERPPLMWSPYKDYKYSNTAYVILGMLVEDRSGQSFDEYVAEHILKPAGMSETFWLGALENERNGALAFGYRENDDGSISRNPDPDAGPRMRGLTYGDDDLISTLADMHKYDQALATGKLLSEKAIEQMLRPVRLSDGGIAQYAQGFRLKTIGGKTVVDHTGSTSGFYAYSKFSRPDSDYGIALFQNVTRGGANFRALQDDILAIMESDDDD